MKRLCLQFVALWIGVATASATLFTDLYVFGDSLSDSGNLSIITGGTQPGPNYWNGRFSDGPVAAEVYGSRGQVFGPGGVPVTPSLAGGNNYAVGGARSGSHPAGAAFGVTSQVTGYLASSTTADPNAMYLVWAGGNDVRDALEDPANANSIITGAIGNLQTVFTDLITAGAQTLLVPNVPDLGLIPEVTQLNDPAAVAGATFLSSQFNAGLNSLLDGFSGAATIYRYDAFTRLNEFVLDGASYGLTNVTDSFLGSGAPNPDEYLFYDTIHPTAVVSHWMMGMEFIPEPGTLGLFALGVAVVAFARRGASAQSSP